MSQDFERGLDELRAGAAQVHAAQTVLPTADLVRRARRNRRVRATATTLAAAAAVVGLGLGGVAAADLLGADPLPPASTPDGTGPDLLDPDASRMIGERSTEPTDPLTDGSYVAFVHGIDPVAGTVDVDLAVFMGGQAAMDWLTENEPEAENPPPNDYVIVNEVEQVQTMPLADGAPIWDLCFTDGEGDPYVRRDLVEWAAAPAVGEMQCGAGPELSRAALYWLDVRDDVVVQVVAQYLP